ncbi:MAG: FHA domain-containing protein [Chloroflexota bacterium]
MSENKIPRPGHKPDYLTLLVGKDKRQVRVRMKDKGIIIGRETKSSKVDFDTKPYDGDALGVSREHVIIAPKKDYFYVQDLDTINSTWHNKVRMKPMMAEELYHGDLLHLGELRIEVYYTYQDEIQEHLGATINFNEPQTNELNKTGNTNSTWVFGETKPWDAKEEQTDNLKDKSD